MPKEKFNSEFKVRTVLVGLKSPDGISAYCRRIGISEVQFYQWQKQIIENADALFKKVPKATERKLANLEAELKRKNLIIAIVTEETLELKKNFPNKIWPAPQP